MYVQGPELVAVDAQIAHATRKEQRAETIRQQVRVDEAKQTEKLRGIRRDLDTVQRAADAAQGTMISLY